MSQYSGKFLTLEGVDGAGKSTHIDWLIQQLRESGIDVVSTREPGGCALSEAVREMVLNTPMHLETETLLMFAARSEHLQQTILPALQQGKWVLCDRFTDSTFAYQGSGRELGAARIAALEQWVHPGFSPDLTWFFDVPLDVARQRLSSARVPDRFEAESAAFFERTRAGYHARVAADPARFAVIDGVQSIEDIRTRLRTDIQNLLAPRA